MSDAELLHACRQFRSELQTLKQQMDSHVERSRFAKFESAGLAIAAVPALFIAPPVGVALGATSAAFGVGAAVGDIYHHKFHSEGKFKEAKNNFKGVVEKLQQQQEDLLWQQRAGYAAAGYGLYSAGCAAGDATYVVAAQGGEQVVRYGSGMSQALPLPGMAKPVVQIVNSADDAAALGSGVGIGSAGSRVVVSRMAVGFAILGAVLSTKTCIESMENASANAPLIDNVADLIRQLDEHIKALS